MKKITSIAVASMLFLSGGSAMAFASTCGDLDANGNVIACGNGSPELLVNVWGTSNSGIPHMTAGSTVHDEAGIAFLCPEWFGMLGCSDISHTDYYRSGARATAQQLQASGFALGQYSYWLTH